MERMNGTVDSGDGAIRGECEHRKRSLIGSMGMSMGSGGMPGSLIIDDQDQAKDRMCRLWVCMPARGG